MNYSVNYNPERALELLRRGSGQGNARFREGQENAIRQVVEGRSRLLVVQKTGWGKSFVYFIATKLLREAGCGPALLFSPLLSLMRNQIAAADRMGVRAVRITSDNSAQWAEVEACLQRDDVDILLISPERLGNEHFRIGPLAEIAERIALLVVDEAHCISDWGHDFRPHYRMIERLIRDLTNVRLLATTATANNRVMDDLRTVLGPAVSVLRGDLNRPSLSLQTIGLPRQEERLAWLAEQIPRLSGHGVIYTLTVSDAGRVAAWLQSRGINAHAYTSQVAADRRVQLEQALLNNRVKALVATTALGMGFDKPDLSFVIHYQSPASVVAYYQQVGRAGRGLAAAYGVLLSGEEETGIADYFIASAFPSREEACQVINALAAAPDGLSLTSLMGKVNLGRGRIEKTVQLLALESPAPIAKVDSRWRLTAASLSEAFWARAERLTRLRYAEQRQMQDYVKLDGGHMAFLVRALDGDPGMLQPTSLPVLPRTANARLVQEAVTFLRRAYLPIEQRKRWPAGGLPQFGVSGSIDLVHQAEPGRALCVWGDAGWGTLVKDGKYRDGRFADELVHACYLLVEQWSPRPAPAWVTCVPSNRCPDLVPDFAERLANRLTLPFYRALEKIRKCPEQKSMANSTQQARNVDGSLRICSIALPEGPVLLIDDMVDSRWTLTVAAWLLRSHGSGAVWPLALARSGHG